MKYFNYELKHFSAAGILVAGMALPLLGSAQGNSSQDDNQSNANQGNASQSNASQNQERNNPYATPDDSFIRMSGTVKSVMPNSFVLSFGTDGAMDEITVEMDDGDRDAEAYALLEGDKVTVSGLIDNDVFQKRTIEASTVYVDKLQTYFYASASDEEDPVVVPVAVGVIEPVLWVQGKVVNVSENEFTLEAGDNDLKIDVNDLPDNPLDDEGYQKLETGDIVSVTGQVEGGFLTRRELIADSVVKLHDKENI